MKYLVFIILLFLKTHCAISQKTSFTLKGRINKDSRAEKLYLTGKFIKAEIPISANKEFFYKGTLTEPEECFIKTDKSYAWSIWITSGEIDITLEEWDQGKQTSDDKKLLKITSISGPAETEKSQWLKGQLNVVSKRLGKLPIDQWKDSMAKYYDPLLEEYILDHPHSKFSAHIATLANSKENIKRFLTLVDREVSTEERIRIETAIKRDSMTTTGLAVQNFEMKTIYGKTFSLNRCPSKYIFLDFWAHDCYPCRVQHPELLKIYAEFHEKGFEIVAVSLDQSKAEWKKAVKHDKLPWIQVSDLKGWNNMLAKRYFIDGIPFNILIDENRKIIAKNLTPSDLQQKLKELFNN